MPSIRPLAMRLSNQARMPSRCRMMVRGGVLDRLEPRADGPAVPAVEEERGPAARGLLVDLLEGEADLIGAGGFEM